MADTVSAIIAEDERNMHSDLQARLRRLWPELRIVAAAGDCLQVLSLSTTWQPEVLFLDTEMPPLGGLEVARRLSANCHVVFLSDRDHHAVDAFRLGATDYVLRPFDDERLASTLQRLRQRLVTPTSSVEAMVRGLLPAIRPKDYITWIKASRGNDIELIRVSDIQYFQSGMKYTSVHTCLREALIRRPVKELVTQLDPDRFWQIHRSTIVNVEAIDRISRDHSEMRVRLRTTGTCLAVSDAYRHLFRQM